MPRDVNPIKPAISNQGAEDQMSEMSASSTPRSRQAPEKTELRLPSPQQCQDAPRLTNSTQATTGSETFQSRAPIVDFKAVIEGLCDSQSELLSLCRQADAKLEQLLLVQLHLVQAQQTTGANSPRLTHEDLVPYEPVIQNRTVRPSGWKSVGLSRRPSDNIPLADGPATYILASEETGARKLSDMSCCGGKALEYLDDDVKVHSHRDGGPCSGECPAKTSCHNVAAPLLLAQWIAPAELVPPAKPAGVGGPLRVGGKACQCDWGAPAPPTTEPAPLEPAPLLVERQEICEAEGAPQLPTVQANGSPRYSTLSDDQSNKSMVADMLDSPRLSDSGSLPSLPFARSATSETVLRDENAGTNGRRPASFEQRPSRKSHIDAIQILKRVSREKNGVPEDSIDSLAGRLVVDHRFNIVVTGVVALNALLVGWQVQNQAVRPGEPNRGLEVAEYVFTTMFTVELLLRAVGLRCAMFWKEHRLWTCIDSALVLMGLLDIVVEVSGIQTMESKQDDTDIARQSTSIGKSIKVMRMARFLRLLRLVRFLTSVRIMVTMIVGSLTALFWLFVLLTIVMYIFGVVLTHGATDWRVSTMMVEEDQLRGQVKRFFGSMDKTMYTLFICITGGLSWSEASDVVMHFGGFYFAVFMFFMFFIFFSVLNIVTGVFVDAAIQQADSDRSLRLLQQEIAKKALLEDLRELLSRLDENCDGVISADEWMERIDDPPVKSLFSRLNIPLTDSVGLFEIFDVDGDGCVSIAELVGGVEKMGGTAQSLQMLNMLKLGERIYELVRQISFDSSQTLKQVRHLLDIHEEWRANKQSSS